jgi:hypothetical protein
MEVPRSSSTSFHDALLPTLITDEQQRQRIEHFRASLAASVGNPSVEDTTRSRSSSLNVSMRSIGALNQSRVRAVSVPRAPLAAQDINHSILNKISLETSIDSDSDASSLFLLRSFADEVQSALQQVEEQRRAYTSAIDELKSQLAASERCRNETEYRFIALEQQATDDLAQYTEMQAKSSMHNRIETGLRTAIQGLESQQAETLKKVTDLEREKSSLASRLEESMSRCTHMNSRLQEEQRTKLDLQGHFQLLETEIARLMEEKDSLRKSCTDEHEAAEAARRAESVAQSALRECEMQAQQQQSRLVLLQSEVAAQKLLTEELRAQMARYRAENEDLRVQLQSRTVGAPPERVTSERCESSTITECGDPPVGESLAKLAASMEFIMSQFNGRLASPASGKRSKSIHIHLPSKRNLRWTRPRASTATRVEPAIRSTPVEHRDAPDITSTSFAVSENSDDFGMDHRLDRSEARSPFIKSAANHRSMAGSNVRPPKYSDSSSVAAGDHSPALQQRTLPIYMSPPSVSSTRAGFAVSPDVEGNVLQTLSSLRELLGMCEKIP